MKLISRRLYINLKLKYIYIYFKLSVIRNLLLTYFSPLCSSVKARFIDIFFFYSLILPRYSYISLLFARTSLYSPFARVTTPTVGELAEGLWIQEDVMPIIRIQSHTFPVSPPRRMYVEELNPAPPREWCGHSIYPAQVKHLQPYRRLAAVCG